MNVSEWSGGETTQIAIYPENKKYKDRNFIWRLSSATVDIDSSVFTKLEDYNRIIMVLGGKLELNHNDKEIVYLNEFDQNEFDGANDTTTVGKCIDYNLMMKKGQCTGKIKTLTIPANNMLNHQLINGFSSYKNFTLGIYSYNSSLDLSVEDLIGASLNQGDFLLLNFSNKIGSVRIGINNPYDKDAVVVITQIFY